MKTLGSVGVVFAASAVGLTQCDQMPATAVEGWNGPADETDIRRWALAHALLAPNPHNIQPWIADLTIQNEITLRVDPDRLLPETDPFGRQILIGHGTFIELLDLAARQRGYRLEISYFPEGEAPSDSPSEAITQKPVAQITFTADANVKPDPLFREIFNRRSTKEPYDMARPLTAQHQSVLEGALHQPVSTLHFARDGARATGLREITRDAALKELYTPAKLEESIDLARIGADEIAKFRDGIDLHGPMFWWLKNLGMMTKEAAMTEGTPAFQGGIDYAVGWASGTPSFGWIITDTNTRIDQVRSGRDYVRLNLAATASGVAMHPVSQVLQEYSEMAELRDRFATTIDLQPGQTVQMLFRLGYAEFANPSPRRTLDSIVAI